jgi:peptidoglycan-associated lipoprotein
MTTRSSWFPIILLAIAVSVAACGKKPPVPVTPPPGTAPGAFPSAGSGSSGGGPVRAPEPPPIPFDSNVTSAPLDDAWANRSIDEINSSTDSPLKPVFFAYDSDEVSEEAKAVLAANAKVLDTYRTWVITIEGHTDERGTAEYNLALGDRRARAVKAYLMSLGITGDRLRTVSYGKEFPFDPGHDEAAWARNRRAHFMLTSK